MTQYDKLTVVKLREELTKRDLPKTGLKAALIQRLAEDDAQPEPELPSTEDAKPTPPESNPGKKSAEIKEQQQPSLQIVIEKQANPGSALTPADHPAKARPSTKDDSLAEPEDIEGRPSESRADGPNDLSQAATAVTLPPQTQEPREESPPPSKDPVPMESAIDDQLRTESSSQYPNKIP
ncbi:MAG: hypothetical protein Q9177_005935 [Variospora cf. flavescens]